MTSCSLYFPSLLGPDVPLEELASREWPGCDQLTHLCKLFSHSRMQALTSCSTEARMLQGMGVVLPLAQDVPLAYFRAKHLLNPVNPAQLWCLDPVYVQIDQEDAVLLANEQLELTEAEARHLIDDLNSHFAQDDLIIHYLTPHQWVLQGAFTLSTHTLGEAMQKNINDHQPAGKDELRWRKLINEMQMLLHAHPINQLREQRGEAVVNSAWLWGGTSRDYVYHYEAIIDIVYSDESFVHDVARVCDIKHAALPLHINEDMLSRHTSLMIFTDQLAAIKTKDVFGWFGHLRRFDNQVLAPLLGFLRQGRLDSLTLYSDTLSMTVTKKDLARWWKRGKAFDVQINRLRKQYGY